MTDPAFINALPIEVLSSILTLGFQSLPLHGQGEKNFLSSVNITCRWWREIALTIPTLWTSISIRSVPEDVVSPTAATSLALGLALYLERSSSASLDLLLVCEESRSDEARSLEALEIIHPHIQRCRSIRAKFTYESVFKLLLPLPGEMSRLKELQLLSNAPNAQALTLAETSNRSPLNILHLLGYAEIDIGGLSLRDVSELVLEMDVPDKEALLARCAASLKSVACRPYPHQVSETLHFPSLQQLSISRLGVHFLSSTTLAPNLEKLALYPGSHLTQALVTPPLQVMTFEHLRTLTIAFESSSSMYLTAILGALPQLCTIVYIAPRCFWTLVDGLVLKSEVVPNLALLRWVYVSPDFPKDVDVKNLRRLLEMRQQVRFEWTTRSLFASARLLAATFEKLAIDYSGRVSMAGNALNSVDVFKWRE